jgi:RluA family pseudouridine synthase
MYHKTTDMKSSHTRATRLTVSRQEDGLSLIDFIASRMRLSRKKAKAILDSRGVFVNRRRIWMARHPLSSRDTVEVIKPVPPPKDQRKLHVLFEDSDYLVADKTPGILSQGKDSAEEMLRESVGVPSLVAVHRLDRDTSGCLLLAKSRQAFDNAVGLFRSSRLTKSYHAIVCGHLAVSDRKIAKPIDGKSAVTIVKTIDANAEASHVLLRIQTGRTHQIRRHLASIGYPVVGDRQYGTSRRVSGRTVKTTRQMLHASVLAFKHPCTGKSIRTEAQIPRDFRECLNSLDLS